MTGDLARLLYIVSVWALPVIFAITLHEAAHGFVAYRLGDDTAWRSGRVTANPLRHIDPIGTILLPALLILTRSGFLFGYAKPVPVNFWRLDNPKRDMVWVAIAGPGTNIALAIVSGLLTHIVPFLPPSAGKWLWLNLIHSMVINVVLAVFNMIPLPPLDGGRVAVGLLPNALAVPFGKIERYGLVILIFLLLVLPYVGEQMNLDLNVVAYVLEWPVTVTLDIITTITGTPLGDFLQ
jgi:Zn-dependent protease